MFVSTAHSLAAITSPRPHRQLLPSWRVLTFLATERCVVRNGEGVAHDMNSWMQRVLYIKRANGSYIDSWCTFLTNHLLNIKLT